MRVRQGAGQRICRRVLEAGLQCLIRDQRVVVDIFDTKLELRGDGYIRSLEVV